jgi:hypothetical protein
MIKLSTIHKQLGESMLVGMQCNHAGTFPGKEGRIQVLAGLALSIQTLVPLFRVIYEQAPHSSQMTREI